MKSVQGNTSKYLTERIKEVRPDILDRMKAGEFSSVRAAALEAGIVEPSFQCPLVLFSKNRPNLSRNCTHV
jgi:hypothetical protein